MLWLWLSIWFTRCSMKLRAHSASDGVSRSHGVKISNTDSKEGIEQVSSSPDAAAPLLLTLHTGNGTFDFKLYRNAQEKLPIPAIAIYLTAVHGDAQPPDQVSLVMQEHVPDKEAEVTMFVAVTSTCCTPKVHCFPCIPLHNPKQPGCCSCPNSKQNPRF